MSTIVLPDDLTAPSYGTGSLAAVLPAVAGSLGIDVTTATGIESGTARAALGLPDARRVVVVLVDGLGMHNLAERGGHAPFLRGLLRDGRTVTTSAPSTTAAALATFGTGTSPGLTGMLGYTQRNPATGGLATLVSWTEQSDPYRPGPKMSGTFGVDPQDLQREPTVLEQIGAALPVVAPGRAKFAGSGMTRAALRGPRHVVAERAADAVDATVRALRAEGLVYLYLGDVDKTGHRDGPDSWQWGHALEEVDGELRRLARSVPRGTVVVVTADHGMVATDPARQHDVATHPELARDVALLGGEPRFGHVYAAPGADVAALATRWADALGDDALVVTGADAVAAGWFGPVADHVRPVVGDVLAVARGRATVVDSRIHPAPARQMPGVHGSLTPTEMHVPLLVAA
ncbi:type I phosphodiesterase/nucleotide pyrophosphatase [Isoptericola jiangsuensis]|uniref:Type I phosphodiesterase/nucleotide pyrophosphatase n=1 Tax=Isoptericola jiangsuensis TaxID=548579 RepID=A0A2A9EYP7_9MICO|nr:alkaline phosphatase family protein [Isoptericola jiangsuensis]PFG43432.1 type I phosphodiesterase/nucleotide pyrophosphatase [Isoptericola jiangsuensis]